jgi:hypothetical protein
MREPLFAGSVIKNLFNNLKDLNPSIQLLRKMGALAAISPIPPIITRDFVKIKRTSVFPATKI